MAVYQIQGPDGSVYEVEGPGGETPEQPSALQRATQYVTKRGQQFVSALGHVASPQSFGEYKRPITEQLTDVATVVGPAVAPGLAAAGLAAGAGASALGADPETAELADVATQAVGGIGQGIQAARGAKALLSARYKEVASAAAQRAMKPEQAMALGNDLLEGTESALTHPKELKAVRPLLQKLTNPQGAPITYGDLDQAKILVQGINKKSYIRGLLTKAMGDMLEGTPEGAALAANNKRWARVVSKPLLKGLTGSHIQAAGMIGAGYEAGQGNFGKAALIGAGSLAGGYPLGVLAAGARAAGPAAASIAGTVAPQIAESPPDDVNLTMPPESPVEPQEEAPPSPGSSPLASAAPGASEDATAIPTDRWNAMSLEERKASLRQQFGGSASALTPYQNDTTPARKFSQEVAAVAKVVGLDPRFLDAVISIENAQRDPTAVSQPTSAQAQTPARGLMQITPGTFKSVAADVSRLTGRTASINDPLDNLVAGALLYKKYLDATNGDVEMAAQLYFGGENTTAHGTLTRQYGQDISRAYATLAAK